MKYVINSLNFKYDQQITTRGAGTMVCNRELGPMGPTNQNKCCGKSGGGDRYIGDPPRF